MYIVAREIPFVKRLIRILIARIHAKEFCKKALDNRPAI
jgi:hypothetical protein